MASRSCVACLLDLNQHRDAVPIQKQMVQRPAFTSTYFVRYRLFTADKQQLSFCTRGRPKHRGMVGEQLLKNVLRAVLGPTKFCEMVIRID